MTQVFHTPVMPNEAAFFLNPKGASNPLLVDCTSGEGGHSEFFLKAFPRLSVAALDADSQIQLRAKERLSAFGDRVRFFNVWADDFFADFPKDLPRPDLILFDLGISVFHYSQGGRGFSFSADESLDMRLSPKTEKSAADLTNSLCEKDLADLIFNFGEERYSRRIAKAIVARRAEKKFERSLDLANVVSAAVPAECRRLKNHPATKTFQALRIAVNAELERLPRELEAAFQVLKVGGRIGVITFHSLEDRIVKNFFREKAKPCICPPNLPICECRGRPECEILTRKAVLPSAEEIAKNSPSRSAKFRAAEKIFEVR